MKSQREITGRFLHERHVFLNDGGATRTIIAEVALDGDAREELTIRGDAGEGALRPGLVYRFWGKMKQHHKYGEQFAFDDFILQTPADREAVIAYLKQCDGIGFATARKIWDVFGPESVQVLRESPEKVMATVPRLKIEKLRAASELLQENITNERAKLDLMGTLHGRGIPKKVVSKLLDDYGPRASLVIRRNAYLLMRYRGCGFLKADKLYLEFGGNPAKPKRQALCAWYAVASNSSGDTWFSRAVVHDALMQNISGTNVNIPGAIKLAKRASMLADHQSMGSTWYAEASKARSEELVAQYLIEAEEELLSCTNGEGTQWPAVEGLLLDDHQRENVALATAGIVGVLAGSPGTGKTHSSAEIIKALLDSHGADMVAVCAPTGKAAVRLTEAMERNGVGLRALTIHSLLKVATTGDDGWKFEHGCNNPLPFAFVIIDEASMLDASLMAALMSARGRGTHYLFVGDPNQLPPVGHGAPLRDMIAAGIPTGTLVDIRRNSGRIVSACAEIRDHSFLTPSAKLDVEAGENLGLIERATAEEQIDALAAILAQFQQQSPRKYDPVWDVQILVAVNKKSPLGRKPLNQKLQDLLNPHGATAGGNPFRVGDKIINTKNGWVPSAIKDDPAANQDGKVYVANGEQAEVLEVAPNKTIARLFAPDRTVLIPRGTEQDAAAEAGGNDKDESGNAEGGAGTGCNWELAYAISCHKSQGSEWPVVIVMIDEHSSARMVCTRNWIYTGISRAKALCLLIGRRQIAQAFCCRDGLRRKTFLVEKIHAMREQSTLLELVEGIF